VAERGRGMNCKPGDLAILKKTMHGVFVGKFVTVIEPHEFVGWWQIEIPNIRCPITAEGYWAALDSWLLPIRPVDLHETEDDLIEVKE